MNKVHKLKASLFRCRPIEGLGRVTFPGVRGTASRTKDATTMTLKQRLLCKDLPVEADIKGWLRIKIDWITDTTVDMVMDVLNTTALHGDGITKEEIPTRQALLKPQSKGQSEANMVVLDVKNNDIVGIMIAKNSPLCRGNMAIYGAGPFVIGPKYRGKGVGFHVLDVISSLRFHPSNLHRDYLGRSNMLAAPRLPSNRGNGCNVGIIPASFYIAKRNVLVDDVITFGDDDPEAAKALWNKEMEPPIPALVRQVPLPPPLSSQLQPLIPTLRCPEIPFKSGFLKSMLADEEDMWRVEELIRDCAQRGDGFGLDEFTDNGYFNRKFTPESHVVVVKNKDDAMVAAVIFGTSSLCRSPEAGQVGGYFIVSRGFRGQGLGKAILRMCIEKARELGYVAILTDVFVTNEGALRLMRKEGFFITATLPNAAVVKDIGFTDTYLFWRSLKYMPPSKHGHSKL